MKKQAIFFSMIVLFLFMSACKTKNSKNNPVLPPDIVNNPLTGDGKIDLSKLPVMTFTEEEHDFGKINQGETVGFGFKFKNTGKSDLLIDRVSTSCGCTASDYPKDPVKPGKEGVVTVTFRSEGKKGFQNKMITIISNTQPNTKVLKIKAMVIVPEDN